MASLVLLIPGASACQCNWFLLDLDLDAPDCWPDCDWAETQTFDGEVIMQYRMEHGVTTPDPQPNPFAEWTVWFETTSRQPNVTIEGPTVTMSFLEDGLHDARPANGWGQVPDTVLEAREPVRLEVSGLDSTMVDGIGTLYVKVAGETKDDLAMSWTQTWGVMALRWLDQDGAKSWGLSHVIQDEPDAMEGPKATPPAPLSIAVLAVAFLARRSLSL